MKKIVGNEIFGNIVVLFLLVASLLMSSIKAFETKVYGKEKLIEVVGRNYVFDDDKNDYNFSETDKYTATNVGVKTLGAFSISGNIGATSESKGIPAYSTENGNVKLVYKYDDSLLNAGLDQWHLIGDSSRKINNISLDDKIENGVIIVQTSKDGEVWVEDEIKTNIFKNVPIGNEPIYETNDIQLANGTYYRVIVAYKTRIRTNHSKILFFDNDEYSYEKHVEVYEFYLNSEGASKIDVESSKKQKVNGTTVKTKANGYERKNEIEYNDPHYGWSLGDFFVSGFTESVRNNEGTPVFLKNVDDQVVLWFKLKNDIDQLNGNKQLSIEQDKEGYDTYFQTPRTDFGRGTLILRYTNHENITDEPILYTNYLESNAIVDAETKVQFFEEGDYEVALDYKIKNDKRKLLGQSIIPETSHYRIFFKFSVRNGNSMVFPIEVGTGLELTNTSLTELGFSLDMAKSRYLKTNIKKEVLKDGVNGLVEDTRYNRPAKNEDKFTEEGIYTITVSNEYTKEITTKKIYVGSDSLMKAHILTKMPISEIRKMLKEGATIKEDGTIVLAETGQDKPDKETEIETPNNIMVETKNQNKAEWKFLGYSLGAVGLIGVITIVILMMLKKRKR